MQLAILQGTPGVGLSAVAHVLIPGRGRDASGFGLSSAATDRLVVARSVYELMVKPNGGRIVCSGYKSPADLKGTSWSPADSPGEVFCGMPEADIMRAELVGMGVDGCDVRVERHSIDTATNFLRSESEGHFGDARPVAIVAQASHLSRMLSVIAPRTLHRPYVGVVVPEAVQAGESRLASVVSRLVLTRLPENTEEAVKLAERRSRRIWKVARLFGLRDYY